MTNGSDPIQSVTMMKTGEDTYRPSRPNEKTDYQHQSTGLTKLEYFTGQALVGLSQNHGAMGSDGNLINSARVAELAVLIAEKTIDELNKNQQ